jgi:tripartite-type tricarboxylate transporter receptor subunit TctC
MLVGMATTGSAEPSNYNYPVNTVTLVTHSKPGAGSDLFLRRLSKALQKEMGVKFVVDYWTGGSGAKAMAQLAKAPADGSVFYSTTPTHITTSLLSKPKATFRDIDYIANVFFDPEVIFTRTESPFKTMRDAVNWAKQHPGRAIWGGASPGSLERQVLERINASSKAGAVIVPHDDGSGLLISALNGTVSLGVGELQELRPNIEAGKFKVISVYFPRRLDQLPDVPTIKEEGLDSDVIRKFRGLAAPKGVPVDTVRQIERAIQAILADPEFKKEYEADSLIPGYMGQDEYRAFMADFALKQEEFLKGFGVTAN